MPDSRSSKRQIATARRKRQIREDKWVRELVADILLYKFLLQEQGKTQHREVRPKRHFN